MKQLYREANKTVRCFKILGGIVPLSPRRNCSPMNTVMSKAKPRKSPHILLFFQLYVTPPHCNASRRHTMAHIRNKAPKRSISRILCLVVRLLCFLTGGLKKKYTAPREIAPNGRLIQKHHLHPIPSVKAPPSKGPMTEEIPNMLDIAAR